MRTHITHRRFSFIESCLIRWKTRSLGADIDALILLTSVLAYMRKDELAEQLKRAKILIAKKVPLASMAHMVFERVEMEVASYIEKEDNYHKARDSMLHAIIHNIQLYGVVLDMLQGKHNASTLDMLRSIIQKAYDEEFSLNTESKRLLEAQEVQHGRKPTR